MKDKNNLQKDFPAELASVELILNYTEASLVTRKVNAQLCKEYRLVLEEVVTKLVEHASANAKITVESFQRMNQVGLRLRCPGNPVILGQENEEDIGGRILEEYEDYLNQSYISGVNSIEFSSAGTSVQKWNLIAMVAAVIGAFLVRVICSDSQITALTENIIYPMTRFYAGCMQTIATPVVFVSMAALIVKLQHKFEHGKLIVETFFSYLFSSLAAIAIGFLVVGLLPSLKVLPDLSSLKTGSMVSFTSVREFIDSVTFSNLIDVFEISNPVPMLLVAILTGIAAGRVQGMEGQWIRSAVTALNGLFTRMLSLVYSIIPLFLFSAILPNLITDGFDFVLIILLMVLIFLALAVVIFAFYAFQLISSGISPVQFVKDYREILRENYRIGSNIQALPYNKRMLARKIKMPANALKERLSLGATVNMDGNCLLASAFTLFLMEGCGISPSIGFCVNCALILILLSVGAPNQPGSLLLAMTFMMGIIGVSSDMYDTVVIAEALLGTAYSFINSVGDIVTVATGAARFERKLRRTAKKQTNQSDIV